jgi:hypothetical protein
MSATTSWTDFHAMTSWNWKQFAEDVDLQITPDEPYQVVATDLGIHVDITLRAA